MGKNKKLPDKLRLFYKGATGKPIRVASEDEVKLITDALVECLPQRSSNAFECSWMGLDSKLQIIVGLESSLRHLKRGLVRAIILDDTASKHLTNLLSDEAHKLNIPLVQAHRLIDIAPKVGLKTLLIVSLVDIDLKQKSLRCSRDPRPKNIDSSKASKLFNRLAGLMQINPAGDNKIKFRQPETILVKSTDKSRAKKTKRKINKQPKQEGKTVTDAKTHVVKKPPRAK